MSTVNTNYNFTTGYEDQLSQLQGESTNAQTALTNVLAPERNLVAALNAKGYTLNGQVLKFDTADEWMAALQKPGISPAESAMGDTMQCSGVIVTRQAQLPEAQAKASEAQAKLTALQLVHDRAFEPLQAMAKLLGNGDIEGATIALQTSRVRVLDDQLKGRIASLQQRNADIAALNTKLADAQKDLAGDKDSADKQKKVADFKNQIDKLNSESQLDMIGIQQLVNKRNEAFDLLSNLLNKFQKTFDNIVSNIR
jgi:hypothetical protein